MRKTDIFRNERLLRWIEGSQALEKIEPFMPVIVQGLGQLDVKLIQDDQDITALAVKQRSSPDLSIGRQDLENWSISFMDQLTLSYLWVLGAYELVRTIDQRGRDTPSPFGSQLGGKLTVLKHTFERLRMPLAKFEPSRRHQKTDSTIAWPAIHQEKGVSWQVAKNVFVSRRDLSDNLLSLLEEIRKANGLPRQ